LNSELSRAVVKAAINQPSPPTLPMPVEDRREQPYEWSENSSAYVNLIAINHSVATALNGYEMVPGVNECTVPSVA
jgi:hypothetical protein